jgi:hypothetical protein
MKIIIFISLVVSALRGCAKNMDAMGKHHRNVRAAYSASQKKDAFEMELNEAQERSVKFLEAKFNSTNTSNVYYENGIVIMDNTRNP